MNDSHDQRAALLLVLGLAVLGLMLRVYVLEGRVAKVEAIASASRLFKAPE